MTDIQSAPPLTILITGGAGFIGSALIRYLLKNTHHRIVNLDKLTYASNLKALAAIANHANYAFEKVDICERTEVSRVLKTHQPDYIIHLAAETHVDRSIDSADIFIQTNINGTAVLLDQARHYFASLAEAKRSLFRFLHVSTDEVYGDLPHPSELDEKAPLPLFKETTPYNPSSPYSASKASSNHLVSAWHRTYGLPTIITNCSNNYGPFQYPEKLIPLMVDNAIHGKTLPIYGSGLQIRDWLYVDDHVKALYTVVTSGQVGETYNIGGNTEKKNIEVVEKICEILEELYPSDKNQNLIANPLLNNLKNPSYKDLITLVDDRPGHDMRYAIDSSKIMHELDWKPQEDFDACLKETIASYIKPL